MDPRYVLVPVLLLESVGVTAAVEAADEVKTEIAGNRWFPHRKIEDYVCEHYEIFEKSLRDKLIFEGARCEYTMLGLTFEPRIFWKRPIEEQLVYLKEPIQELGLLTEAPRNH